MVVTVGEMAPEASFDAAGGQRKSLAAYRAAPLVLYFYSKDDTTGCTREAQDFTARAADFAAAGAAVLGISRDTVASHAKFASKYGLAVELGSDSDGSMTEAFSVWVEKSMYGRTYMGIERATFLIDRNGRVAEIWRKVKVAGHVGAVLAAVHRLT